MWTLKALNLHHFSPIDVNRGMLRPPIPVVHNQLLCLADTEGKAVVLAPHRKVSDLLPIGCLIVVGGQAYHRCAVGKLNDGVGVVGEQSTGGDKARTPEGPQW